tara:strand:- start:236 stop:358 length:123 start_codon:yes stop_codon:yes gene_type:complete
MKKIIILLFIGFLFSSCGKKGAPFYEKKEANHFTQIELII